MDLILVAFREFLDKPDLLLSENINTFHNINDFLISESYVFDKTILLIIKEVDGKLAIRRIEDFDEFISLIENKKLNIKVVELNYSKEL